MSDDQMNWLLSSLGDSNAKWKLVGNQVMFMKLLGNLFLNMDAWDGYPRGRDQIIDYIHEAQIKNVVFATGDIHTSWVAEIPHNFLFYAPSAVVNTIPEWFQSVVTSPNILVDAFNDFGVTVPKGIDTSVETLTDALASIGDESNPVVSLSKDLVDPLNNSVAVEYVVPSISSDNFDEIFGFTFLARLVEVLINGINPHIRAVEFVNNGFVIMDFNESRVKAVYNYVDILQPNKPEADAAFAFRTNVGESIIRPDVPHLISLDYGPLAPETIVNDEEPDARKQNATIIGVYPNPARNGETNLQVVVREKSNVKIDLLSSTGILVRSFVNEKAMEPGLYQIQLNLKGLDTNGVYNLIIDFGTEKFVRRILLK